MSSLLWISALSPLFFYSPSPAYFATTNQTAAWAPQANPIPSSSPGNDSIQLTSGPAGVVLPSVYRMSLFCGFSDSGGFGLTGYSHKLYSAFYKSSKLLLCQCRRESKSHYILDVWPSLGK